MIKIKEARQALEDYYRVHPNAKYFSPDPKVRARRRTEFRCSHCGKKTKLALGISDAVAYYLSKLLPFNG